MTNDEHDARVAEQFAPGRGDDLLQLVDDLADEQRDSREGAAPFGALPLGTRDEVLAGLVDHLACHSHHLSTVNSALTCRESQGGQDLNLQPAVLETAALPIEPPPYRDRPAGTRSSTKRARQSLADITTSTSVCHHADGRHGRIRRGSRRPGSARPVGAAELGPGMRDDDGRDRVEQGGAQVPLLPVQRHGDRCGDRSSVTSAPDRPESHRPARRAASPSRGRATRRRRSRPTRGRGDAAGSTACGSRRAGSATAARRRGRSRRAARTASAAAVEPAGNQRAANAGVADRAVAHPPERR